MFTCNLNPNSRTTLTEQLYTALRGDMERGSIRPGERMPSKRELAAHLNISTATVEAAYARLISEGRCESRPRSGIYALSQPFAPAETQQTEKPPVRWNFGTGAADAGHFPYATWARLMREVLSEQSTTLLLSGDPQGDAALRREIAGYLHRMRGVDVSPDAIVLGSGTEVLVSALVSLIGRERLFAVEDPGYSRVRRILVASGARIVPTPLCDGAIDIRSLYAGGAGAAYVTPTHQFPTGEEMQTGQREALLRWERETGGYILEDDYDSEFRFSGRPIPALQSLDGGERVVYLNTFAKSLAPSLRISYMVLPPHLLERWRRDFWFYSSTVPSFEQYALARFMERGHFERHLNRTRTRYKARREALLAAARDTGLTRVGSFAGGDAGLHLLLWMDGRWSEAELVARAVDAGVGVVPLSACDLTPPPPGRPPALILGYTRIAAVDMAPALRRLKAAWAF